MATTAINVATYKAMSTRQKKIFWQSHPVRGDIAIELPDLPAFLMNSDNDDTVVKELYWTNFRGWERTSMHIWGRIAGEAASGIVLDVGSYSGIYSLVAALANPTRRILAVDIQPRCLDRLEQNGQLNGIDTITTVHAACIDRAGMVSYSFYEEADVLSSIASVEPNPINDRTAEAPAITIDGLVEEHAPGGRVRLIKIDVEGAEDKALGGAARTLDRDRPDVLIEINDRRRVSAVRKLFPRGYHCYSIDDSNPRVRRVGAFSAPFEDRNFLFSTRPIGEVAALADWTRAPSRPAEIQAG